MSNNSIKKLECDYLVIGGGATGMAFVDEMIHNSRNLKVVLVDKHAKPGGHWNDAYPFVRLHAPAAWYGVNSRVLGRGGADLATKAQILAYYELVMEDLKSTGRLSYFPQCEYLGEGKFKSLLQEGLEYEVKCFTNFTKYKFRK
jgi:cation diffusion facilitator CzcD-associated flavoprotein CzcO